MAWTDLSGAFAYGSKLTSAQMQNLRDNLTALAQGDAGAPKIKDAALAAGVIGTVNSVYAGSSGYFYYAVLAADSAWYRCSGDMLTNTGGGT